ncbi:hypothetical protein [Symmachiella dynata]|uniref:Uncharacterized protein n=1 Tax=Symmachiella dynata TaxID=2527995 RepID=A0A517ZN86_9PLAN|nr:hypothetical protein [Symmachiella dynata]QDT48328.1 hypothetical protein Pan258_23700 [Symmachiella dynata]QDU43920.1 hypothetical protein Mal52_23980 [Symmachiella dynata]
MASQSPQLVRSAAQAARTLQIIYVNLAIVPSGFLAYLLVAGVNQQQELGVLSIIAVVDAAAMFVAWIFAPNFLASKQRTRIADLFPEGPLEPFADDQSESDSVVFQQLYGVYQYSSIIAAAILEGAIFLNLFAYFTEGHPVNLVIGGAFILLLLTSIPTASRIQNWVEGEIVAIEQMRRF